MSKTRNTVIFIIITILLILSIMLNVSMAKHLKDVFIYNSQCVVNVADYNQDIQEIINGNADNDSKNRTLFNVKQQWDNLTGFLINAKRYSINSSLLSDNLSKVNGTMIRISDTLQSLLLKDVDNFTDSDREFLKTFVKVSNTIQKSGSSLRSKINFILPVYTQMRVKGNLNSIVDAIINSNL